MAAKAVTLWRGAPPSPAQASHGNGHTPFSAVADAQTPGLVQAVVDAVGVLEGREVGAGFGKRAGGGEPGGA